MFKAVAAASLGLHGRLESEGVVLEGAQRIGDVAERAEDDRLVLRVGLLEGPRQQTASAASAPPSIRVCKHWRPWRRLAGRAPGMNSVPSEQRAAAETDAQGHLRKLVAIATPTCALAACRLDLGGANVGPLLDQLRRQGERQLVRQLQVGELEALGDRLAGQPAGQGGQQVALLRQHLSSGGKVDRLAPAPPAGWRHRRREWRRGPTGGSGCRASRAGRR